MLRLAITDLILGLFVQQQQQQQQQQPLYSPLSGTTQVSQYQNKHSPTHNYPNRQPSFTSFLHLLWSTASSLVNFHAWQSFCITSFQVLFVLPFGLEPSLHTPCISSPSHCLFFTTYAHTITTCFAVVPRLCHLFLVSLSTVLGTLSFTLISHIHLTIHVSTCWSATSFTFLADQVSLPCSVPLCTQLWTNV